MWSGGQEEAKAWLEEQRPQLSMPRKPTELPPAVARRFAEDMGLYHATKDSIKRDEIASRQAWLLSEHLGPREKQLRVIDVKQMFVEMKDHA